MIGAQLSHALTRPALRYHGGKWKLAPWIIAHLPPHRIYVEPFGGAASILLNKSRSYGEVYNDLDDEIVGLFRILQDERQSSRLIALLTLVPYARQEFRRAYEATDDPILRSLRLIIRSFMGFGSDGHNAAVVTGFRANSNRSGTTPAQDWANYPPCLAAIIERMRGVVIEHRPALQVMDQHDGPDTLHYVDPPYLPQVRSQKSRRGKIRYHAYRHEMTQAEHEALLDRLVQIEGMAVVSGYPSPLYDAALGGWQRDQLATYADGARPRTEVLWINPRAWDALHARRPMELPL